MNVIKFHKTAAEMNEMFPQGMLVETINQNIKKEKKIQELEEEIKHLNKLIEQNDHLEHIEYQDKEIDELKEENKKLKEEIYAWKYQFGRERLIENK